MQTVLVASCELALEFGKIGTAFVNDHGLAIDDGLIWKVEGARNDGEPPNPIVTGAGEGLAGVTIDMELDAVAVYLIS